MKKYLLLLSLALVVGCSTGIRGFPPTGNIVNFDKVDASIFRGGQPNNTGMQFLKNNGVKTIINLRMTNDVLKTEELEAVNCGITYTNIPMQGWGRPTDGQIMHILSIILNAPKPIYIHCQYGCDRTGTVIACYRIAYYKWTAKQTLEEAKQYGMSNLELGMKSYVRHFEKIY